MLKRTHVCLNSEPKQVYFFKLSYITFVSYYFSGCGVKKKQLVLKLGCKINEMYLRFTSSLVPPPKVHHSDTNSLNRRTKTSDCTETRLSDSETNSRTFQLLMKKTLGIRIFNRFRNNFSL